MMLTLNFQISVGTLIIIGTLITVGMGIFQKMNKRRVVKGQILQETSGMGPESLEKELG